MLLEYQTVIIISSNNLENARKNKDIVRWPDQEMAHYYKKGQRDRLKKVKETATQPVSS